jgi:hypothetical protein
MSERFVVAVGYEHWAMDPEDAIALMRIFKRSTCLKRDKWDQPYEISDKQAFPVRGMEWAEVNDADTKDSKFEQYVNTYLQAAREAGR